MLLKEHYQTSHLHCVKIFFDHENINSLICSLTKYKKQNKKGETKFQFHGMKKYLVQIHIYMPKYYTCVIKDSEFVNSYAYAVHTSRRSMFLLRR